MKEEIQMTEKQPRKESATTAPKIGKIVLHPFAILYTFAALTLFMLNSCIRYTIKLLFHPAAASDSPAMLPINNFNNKSSILHYIWSMGKRTNT